MPRRGLADAGGGELPHHVGHRERLRERLREGGEDALPDYELLELVLFAAIPRQDVKPLAKRLLAHFDNNLAEVLSAPRERLREVEGVGDVVIANGRSVRFDRLAGATAAIQDCTQVVR